MPSSTGSPLIANRTVRPVAALMARMAGPLDTIRSAASQGYPGASREGHRDRPARSGE